MKRSPIAALAAACTLSLALTACEAPSGADSELVIGTVNLGGYNPVNGYSVDGNSPFYDGLLRLQEDPGEGPMPDLAPALAASAPEPDADARTWRVELREDVTFSDGSAFDSGDVAATYRAVLDPASASEVIDTFTVIDSIETPDEHTVVFHLDAPTPTFSTRLTLGIMPSEAIESGTPAADWKVNSATIGTGAYTLESLSADTAVLEAREDYWRTEPELSTVTLQAFADSSALTSAIADGRVSGGAVGPRAVDRIAGGDKEVFTARTADWRGLTLPSDNPFTAEADVRLALNLGVDRQQVVDNVLAGHGTPASTPIGEFYGEAFNPEARFPFDRAAAAELLNEAGWVLDEDGVRTKNGHRAELTITYVSDDTVRGDIAAELAEQLGHLGVDVEVTGSDWDHIEKDMDSQAIVFAGGEQPYDLDRQVRSALHTRTKTSGAFDNPSNVAVPGVDELIESAAHDTDPESAAADYRRIQDLYLEQPSYLVVAFLEHTYVADTSGWEVPDTTFEPHVHGSDWGPWWDLASWRKA